MVSQTIALILILVSCIVSSSFYQYTIYNMQWLVWEYGFMFLYNILNTCVSIITSLNKTSSNNEKLSHAEQKVYTFQNFNFVIDNKYLFMFLVGSLCVFVIFIVSYKSGIYDK